MRNIITVVPAKAGIQLGLLGLYNKKKRQLGPCLRRDDGFRLTRWLFALLPCLLMTLVLAACVEGPPVSTPPDMTFDNLKPVEINAAKIDVIDSYKPPLQDPNVEHTFRTPPYVAAEKLLKKQLVAAGTENTLRVIIDDASVIRVELPTTKGFMGLFVQEPSERLKAKMLVRFELVDPKAPDIIIGHAEVVARREKSLMEGISPADRDQAYFTLTEDMMDDLNDGLRTIVKNTFGKKD